jgi:hypothetical protein
MRVLFLNQTFAPDNVSSAQHAADLAAHLAERGHEVAVIAGRRSYDNPQVRFPARERRDGVEIRRVRSSGLGKSAKWRRAVDFLSFLVASALALLFSRRYDVVVAMTSPPLISFLAALFVKLRGGRLVLWVMDLNPDEAIAAGWLRPDSVAARGLAALLASSLATASQIVAMDEFMRDRLLAKGAPASKLVVLPPWSHNEDVIYDSAGRKAFRAQHGLEGKLVVMYSGNHSPCHPLDTMLAAALRLKNDAGVAFCFVGGGSEFGKVRRFAEANGLSNVVCLPYQPRSRLSASLSAADLHVVVMGDPFVGIVHPCKIYNILALGIPYLYIGPTDSHIVRLTPEWAVGDAAHLARHGDVEAVLAAVHAMRSHPAARESLRWLGHRFSPDALLPRFFELLEHDPLEVLARGERTPAGA